MAANNDQNQGTSPPPKSPTSPRGMAGMASMSRPITQSMPDNRQQSFEEIYGPPENFLEIEVCIGSPLPSQYHHKETKSTGD